MTRRSVDVVVTSLGVIPFLGRIEEQSTDSGVDLRLLVIDEGDIGARRRNLSLARGTAVEFYGPTERRDWFRNRFGASASEHAAVIPPHCHAESSFGFLASYADEADYVVELDDDIRPVEGFRIVDSHLENLENQDGVTATPEGRWYNTLDNLRLNQRRRLFPRGYPYDQATRRKDGGVRRGGGRCALNMGLWIGQPDLDAATLLEEGSLDGRSKVESLSVRRNKVVMPNDAYLPVCSMNASFRHELIPAFYQLYMNYLGVDRYDDIWSGIILKKIADHMGDKVSVGAPAVFHDKRRRDVRKDLEKEREGVTMTETFWKIVDGAALGGSDYSACYLQLAQELKGKIGDFGLKVQRDFMRKQVAMMTKWVEIIESLD